MALTIQSSTTPFASPAQFLQVYDYRPPGQLVRDDGTQASAANLLTDSNLAWALMEATGEIETAAMVYARYKPLDLQNLAASGTAGSAILAKMTIDIAAEFLRERRLIAAREPFPQSIRAFQKLEALRNGDAIFPFTECAQDGVPDNYTFQQQDINNLNLITRNIWSWGQRGSYNSGTPGASAGSG